MRFCVCIKQVPDVDAPVHTGRMVLNAYDASAVEEALVLKEDHGGSVDLVLVGPSGAAETIRKALAMGADEASHIVTADDVARDSFAIATILHAYFRDRPYDVIACGKQSQDSDAGLTGPMLATMLDVAYASNAVALAVDGQQVVVTRQGDVGQEVIVLRPPCLVTCSNDMNNPRIPSLRGIMAAKKKDIAVISLTDLGVGQAASRTEVLAIEDIPDREPGIMIEGTPDEVVPDLVHRLQNDAKVI
jgi:electron transfer flavoprotein beta subunit